MERDADAGIRVVDVAQGEGVGAGLLVPLRGHREAAGGGGGGQGGRGRAAAAEGCEAVRPPRPARRRSE